MHSPPEESNGDLALYGLSELLFVNAWTEAIGYMGLIMVTHWGVKTSGTQANRIAPQMKQEEIEFLAPPLSGAVSHESPGNQLMGCKGIKHFLSFQMIFTFFGFLTYGLYPQFENTHQK